MPTALRESGFNFVIYTNDHEPMHVHAFKENGEVVINLGDEDTPVSVSKVRGINRSAERRALKIVSDNQEFLQAKWKEIYG